MCRAGGRRCPGQYDPAKAAARNAKRRAQRAAAKRERISQESGAQTFAKAAKADSQAEPAQKVAPVSVEERDVFGPLDELNLPGQLGENMRDALSSMEKAAKEMESQGSTEAANIIRMAGRELVAASPVRESLLYAYYEHRVGKSIHEGRLMEARAYQALSEITDSFSYAKWGGGSSTVIKRTLDELSKPLEQDESLSFRGKYLAEEYRNNLDKREVERSKLTLFKDGDEGYTGGEVLDGRDEHGNPIPPERLASLAPQVYSAMTQGSKELVSALYSRGGTPSRFGPPEAPEGFRRIGTGAESIVYLQESTGLVYKVPHAENMVLQNREDVTMERLERLNQEAYAMIDDNELRKHGVENIRTAFISAESPEGKTMAQVQPYCAPSEWQGMWLSESAIDELDALGVTDFHEGNVLVNAETGQIRLIDCLPIDREGEDEEGLL